MAHMKDLYYNVQEMLREGKSVRPVAKAFDLPVSLVKEIQEDMEEYDVDFQGNCEES